MLSLQQDDVLGILCFCSSGVLTLTQWHTARHMNIAGFICQNKCQR